jgi:hypothetical protein
VSERSFTSNPLSGLISICIDSSLLDLFHTSLSRI